MSRKQAKIAAGFVVMALTLFFGILLGQISQRHQGRIEAAALDERNARIMAWVIDRNPKATIKEFQGFSQILLAESEQAGIDYRLIMAQIDKESQFVPSAVGTTGEIGLMQVLPSTALLVVKSTGMDGYRPPVRKKGTSGYVGYVYEDLGSLGEPEWNLRIGIAYLKWQVDRFGMNPTALRAYNRNPDHAKQYWPWDHYAEDIAGKYLALTHLLPQ